MPVEFQRQAFSLRRVVLKPTDTTVCRAFQLYDACLPVAYVSDYTTCPEVKPRDVPTL